MNSSRKLFVLFFLILVVYYPKIETKYIQNENQSAKKEVYVKVKEVIHHKNASSDDSESTKDIKLNSHRIIERLGQLVDITKQDHTINFNGSIQKTTRHSLNYPKIIVDSINIFNKEGKDIVLKDIMLIKERALHQHPKASFDEEAGDVNSTYSTDSINTERVHFNRTEKEFLYDKQYSLAESGIINGTLHDNQDVSFDWRRFYDITTPEQYPYSVLILPEHVGICTGSIITEEWVLTAAHCIVNATGAIDVYAGVNSHKEVIDYRLGIGYLPPTAQVQFISRVIMHPDFKFPDCDIALLKVGFRFQMTNAVNMVWLATTSWKESYDSYAPCEVTGFGKVQLGETNIDDFYRKTSYLEIKSPCTCLSYLHKTIGKLAASRMLCNKPKQDYGTCKGDSGGGLVCGNRLRGVVSFMIKVDNTKHCKGLHIENKRCADLNTINGFVDVCPFLNWINNYTSQFHPTQISKECKYIKNGSFKIILTKYLIFCCILTTGLINTCFC